MTGPNAYTVPDLMALLQGVTEPCCAHYHDHIKEIIGELERQTTLCECCGKDPADCEFKMFRGLQQTADPEMVARALEANYWGGFEEFQKMLMRKC